ncbi:hypothetical protein A3F05_03855 [Candidatus Saccharibacteria bacterium RIFCSPHIGHO2_12_FULL_47_17]|nr:MAG: hypothetical protein A3F05_03855 [Candidatus Saccharibacteria bacterium RIFCSPHIGHO2_12_FULL_47_17]
MSEDSSKEIPPKKNFGGPLRAIANALAIFLFSQLIAALLIELFAALYLNRSPTVSILSYSAIAQFFYILIAEVLAVAAVLWILKRRKLSLVDIGWGRRLAGRDFTLAIGGFITFFVLLIVVNASLAALIPSYNLDQTQDVGFKTVSVSTDKILAFVALVVLPPLGEEFLMRGYLYSILRSRWSFVLAGLVTSALFGAAHLLTGSDGILWAAAVDTFILSLVLVYLREKSGALYAPIMVHGLNNILAFSVYFST